MTGENIKKVLAEHRLQIKDVAENMGTSASNLSAGLAKTDVRTGLLERIAEVTGIPIAVFYGEDFATIQTAEKEAEARRQAEWEAGAAERAQRAAEREKAEIARKLKEKQRRRELEAQVRQEMIDSGELFGEPAKRPPIPRDVVDAVYRRDGARCVYCGSTENLQLDHIIPFSKGGATTLENLQLLCQKCNLEKSNKIG